MSSETQAHLTKNQAQGCRDCNSCKKNFIIEPDDFSFYEKVRVPPPTLCPECRYIRRLLDRNEYNFYKRKCDATGKDIISIYRPLAPFPVYEQEYWKSDAFDARQYGRDFNFERPFFEQYEELRRAVPHLAMVNSRSVNSEYTNQSQDNKDCYMLVTSGSNEKCIYGSWNQNSHFCGDCYMAFKSEFCYECINIAKCSKCIWCQDCSDSVVLKFCIDCRGCLDCFGCVGLREKQYYWFNKSLTKQQYEEKLKGVPFDRNFIKDSMEKLMNLRASVPVKYYHGSQIQNSTGDYIENCKRTRYAFNCKENKDTTYMQDAWLQTEDCLDCTEIIIGQLSYEIQGVETPHRSMFIRSCFNSITDSRYCDMCFGAKEKIIEHMQKTKEWGEYFPGNVSPFAYNESMAQDYFPMSKDEAIKAGYAWYDHPPRDYQATLLTKDLPKTFDDAKENITEEIIQCSSQNSSSEKEKYPLCATAFKITSLEFSLYKILNLSIPEKCFPCRRQDRFSLRNPRKLWRRICMCGSAGSPRPELGTKAPQATSRHFHGAEKCKIEFETSYSPDRPEIVYCEKCYQQEIY